MFDAVARRYDVTNDILSLGQDRRWRRQFLRVVQPTAGERVLDLAAGTGTSSVPFQQAGAYVVPTDFSLGMLRVGKANRPELPFTAGDGTKLPYADDTFDAVTISFGLRNIVDPVAGLREMLRVTSPDAYVYLAESIRAWPDQRGLAKMLVEAGWKHPRFLNLSGGIVALHHATA